MPQNTRKAEPDATVPAPREQDETALRPADARAQDVGDMAPLVEGREASVPQPRTGVEGRTPTVETAPTTERVEYAVASSDAGRAGGRRQELVPIVYAARKTRFRGVPGPTPQGEHIDVVVPDEEHNEAAAEIYVEQMLGGQGPLTPKTIENIQQGETHPGNVHLVGTTYHFAAGGGERVTWVRPEHVSFLKESASYVFREATDRERETGIIESRVDRAGRGTGRGS